MSDIERRQNRSPRRAREKRAYRLVTVGGAAALVAAVGLLLTIFTAFPAAVWVTAAIVAVVCALLFRRTVSS